jgi:hypothetical protein
MNQREYFDFLARYDWTYAMSDDHSVWTRGEAEKVKKDIVLRQHPEWQKMHDAFYNWAWKSRDGFKKPVFEDYV